MRSMERRIVPRVEPATTVPRAPVRSERWAARVGVAVVEHPRRRRRRIHSRGRGVRPWARLTGRLLAVIGERSPSDWRRCGAGINKPAAALKGRAAKTTPMMKNDARIR